MIRKVCLSIVCLAVGFAVSAQTTEAVQPSSADVEETVEYDANPHKVVTNSFWANWFVSLGGGAQMYFGDGDSEAAFVKRLTGAMDVAVGKWFTPVVGARLMYTGFNANGASTKAFLTGEQLAGSMYDYAKFGAHNIHADFMLNVNNLFCGYKEDRVWSFIPYVGVGWGFHKGPNGGLDNEPVIPAGLLNSFRVAKHWDINLDVRGTLVNDAFDGEEGGMNWEGILTATIGVTYKIGNCTWERPKTVYRTDRSEANALRRELTAANQENVDLKKSLKESEARANVAPKEVIKQVAADDIVLFQIGESKLSKAAQVSLGSFAGMIKDMDPNTVYVITGYADSATGSKARNEKLSKARAEAAYDCLVKKYGVNPDQLKVDYKGGVENMFFNDPSLNRAVIITME